MSQFQDQINTLEATINIGDQGLRQAKMKLKMLKAASKPGFNETPFGKKLFGFAREALTPFVDAQRQVIQAIEQPREFRINQWILHQDRILGRSEKLMSIRSKFYQKYVLLSLAKLLIEGQYLQSQNPEDVTIKEFIQTLESEIKRVAALPKYVKEVKVISEPVPA